MTRTPQRSSRFLGHVRAAVLAGFEPELLLCERVAVLQAAGYKHAEIGRLLPSATPAALKAAEGRVKAAAEALDAGD